MDGHYLPLDPPTNSSTREVDTTRRNLKDKWEHDPNFFTKFFPINAHIRQVYRESEAQLRSRGRWIGIPGLKKEPNHVWRLCVPLNKLLNGILRRLGVFEDSRRFLNTSSTSVYPNLNYPNWPQILLVGAGEHFSRARLPRPQADYTLGISPLEVRLESEDEKLSSERLATNVQHMFIQQDNRRFAFGMVISQQTLTVYLFDRSGVLSSPSLDYHVYPEQLCAIVSGLASPHAARIGLDTTVLGGDVTRIRTKEVKKGRKFKEIYYHVTVVLFYSPDFGGRGTICYAAFEASAPQTMFVIKDSWVANEEMEGKESETLLLIHIQKKGVNRGVVQLRHSETVHIVDHTGRSRPDTVFQNRRLGSGDHSTTNRIHTRIVLSPYGKPLDCFSNRREILLAYYDAVQAHRQLYEVAGVLHRDIKPENILINPGGVEGNRGILIDFDHAIRTDNKSSYSEKTKIGTYMFMSRNALEGRNINTCLDDLESFYYVLLYLVLVFTKPHVTITTIVPLFDTWQRPMAHDAKSGFFYIDFPETVKPWFGPTFQTLVVKLHTIFKEHALASVLATHANRTSPVLDARTVYDRFLSSIREAITDLELEEANEKSGVSSTSDRSQSIDIRHKRKQAEEENEQSLVFSWTKPSQPLHDKIKRIKPTAAATRSRRRNANYGVIKAHVL